VERGGSAKLLIFQAERRSRGEFSTKLSTDSTAPVDLLKINDLAVVS
jgi:hypothetical protein